MFPHTRYPILALASTVPRPSLSNFHERTLSLQGGCDIDRHQERDDRVGDASEYERECGDEGHKNTNWNAYTVGGLSSSEQAYTTRYMALVAFARRCAFRFRFTSATRYARHVLLVGRQGRNWVLKWVRGMKVGGRWCSYDEDVEKP
jgi:hypothetical protein